MDIRLRLFALALAAAPALRAQEPDSAAARDLRDSLAIAGVLPRLEADTIALHNRRHAELQEVLSRPIVFMAGSRALPPEAQDLVKAKAWILYRNPQIQLTLVAAVDTTRDDESRSLARDRVDNVRKLLEDRAIDLARVTVREVDGGPFIPAVDSIGVLAHLNEWSNLDIPPASAEPPPKERWLGLADRNKRYAWGTVRIFYATDRARSPTAAPDDFYSGRRTSTNALEFGRLEVSVPRVHRSGVVEQPHWYTIDKRAGGKFMMVRSIMPLAQASALDSIRATLRKSSKQEALVFIHGYNVTFNDAALRTAQLTYDLGFDGAPILYSWPSRGHIYNYNADIESADYTVDHLAAFLDSIVAVTGAKRVHVIAHSMGNRALTFALDRLASGGRRDTLFNTVVMAAADVDAQRFEQQLAGRIRPLMRRMTIYMSDADMALRASRILSTNLRLGEAVNPVLVVQQAETIDASSIKMDLLGHGYIGSSVVMIDDLADIINRGLVAPRPRLHAAVSATGNQYWVIGP